MFPIAPLRHRSGGSTLVDPLLNKLIVVEDTTVQTRLDSALTSDILPSLQTMTGQSFSVTNSSATVGVVRVRTNGTLATQQYRITASPSSDVLIEGGGWRGCQHGLFAWLAELGVQQLAPSSRWRLTPSSSDLRLTLTINRTPIFKTYSWGPQGTVSGGRWPAGGATATFHIDAWQEFLRWNGRPLAHCVGTGPENQAFAGHTDPFAYSSKKAQFDADDNHFALHSPPWLALTAYYVNDEVTCNGHKYQCVGAGTSAASGGPTGTGASIADGSVTWSHDNIFCGAGGAAHSERRVGAGVFHMTHGGPGGVDTPGDYSTQAGLRTIYASYVTDTIDTNLLAALPTHPEIGDLKFGVGASVADGAKTCADYKCRDSLRGEFSINQDATGSDLEAVRAGKIYALAKAARPAVDFELTLYAYDRQSAPPTPGYSINPNIRVLLAQNIYAVDGLPARVLLERWVARRDLDGFKLGIYDYWALPQFVFSGATFPSSLAWRRAREWINKSTIDTLTTESTYSAGAIGMQIYGLQQMLWRGSSFTDDQLVSDWCTKAFGAAAPNVKRMLDRWWKNEHPAFVGHGYEMGLAFDDLEQADLAVIGDVAARPRVAAMMAYLLYLHYSFLWADLIFYQTPPPPGDAGAESLAAAYLTHVWRTAHTIMIDAKWVQDVVIAASSLSSAFKTQWAVPSDEAQWSTWRTNNGITAYTDAQIRSAFETVRATYTKPTPASYTTPITSSLLTPYTPTGTSPITHNYVNGDEGPATGHEYIFEVRSGAAGALVIEGSSTTLLGPRVMRCRLYHADTGVLVEQDDVVLPRFIPTISPLTATKTYDLTIMTPGYYRLFIENARAEFSHRIVCRGDLPIVRVGSYNRLLWNPSNGFLPRYFFVPKGLTYFHFFTTSTTDLSFIDDSGITAARSQISLYVHKVTVPNGQSQKVWRWEGNPAGGPAHGIPRLLDVDEWTAPTKNQMIVPSNLWNE
jgi:hypothetical protein